MNDQTVWGDDVQGQVSRWECWIYASPKVAVMQGRIYQT